MLSRNVMKTGVMIIVTCLVLIISTFAAADDQEKSRQGILESDRQYYPPAL